MTHLMCPFSDPSGRYRGVWHFDKDRGEWIGNPAECAEVQDLLKTISHKNKAEGKERHHAVAMKYEYLVKMMAWSRSIVPGDVTMNPPPDHKGCALVARHVGFRTFLQTGWMLWLRYVTV